MRSGGFEVPLWDRDTHVLLIYVCGVTRSGAPLGGSRLRAGGPPLHPTQGDRRGVYGFSAQACEQAAVFRQVPEAGWTYPAAESREAGERWLSDVSCTRPLRAYRDRVTRDVRVGWDRGTGDVLELPCGKCVGCRLDRAYGWTVRIMHEAQLSDRNVCATLTYDDGHLPPSLSLEYRDFQLFMKRLRRRLVGADGQRPVRFFVCGEYGKQTSRPHFHAILFNFVFPDQVKLGRYYRSSVAEEVWGNGNVVVDVLTPQVAAYVAGYVLHKASRRDLQESVVDRRTGELSDRRPEFVQMSRRPGIGSEWFGRFGSDLFPHDFAIQEGRKFKVPRYYFEKYVGEADGAVVEKLLEARYQRALLQLGESTVERRAVREAVAEARVHFYEERGL